MTSGHISLITWPVYFGCLKFDCNCINFRRSSLVSDGKPDKSPPPVVSGIDMVVVLDVSDDVIMKRAYGRTGALSSSFVS